MKKTLLFVVCICFACMLRANTTDISTLENVVYPTSVKGASGSNVALSVNMKNAIAMTGFQFDIELPTGISVAKDEDGFYLIDLSETRTTTKKTDYFSSAPQSDGSVRVMASSTSNYTFSGNDGEVAVIQLSVASDVPNGNYPIILKNIVMSDATSKTYEVEQIESVLTIESGIPSFCEGYKVWIEPFTLTEDRDDIEVLMENATEATSVEFDLVLPTAYIDKEAYEVALGTSTAGTKKYACSIEDNEDGSLHVSCTRKSTNVIPEDAGCVLLLGLWYTDENENPLVSDPVCEFTLKNVIVTGTDETEYKVAPYTGYFKVGTEAKGNISLEGDYTYVDLTDMDVDETTSVALSNPNGLIYVADGATIANTTNVIEGETCNNLVLTDKCAFAAPKAFTASKASYTRESGNKWGTICVPFELASDEKIQYFTLDASGVDLTNGTLTFTEASNVSAGTPAVFCRADGGSMSLSATNASIAVGDAGVADGGLKLVGTYAPITITGDNYYIAKDAFWQADSKNVSVPAFRAYFEGTATGVKSFNINTDESTGVKSVTLEVDKQVIYDLMGRQLKNTEKGINIVNGKKVLVK